MKRECITRCKRKLAHSRAKQAGSEQPAKMDKLSFEEQNGYIGFHHPAFRRHHGRVCRSDRASRTSQDRGFQTIAAACLDGKGKL